LFTLADVTVGLALNGDMAAIREIADRLDGKAQQPVSVGGDDQEPLQIVIKQMVSSDGTPIT
jgi:hypothetical protein